MTARITALCLALASAVPAQQATAPAAAKFEVVSIHVVPANAPPTVREMDFTPVLPGGQYVDSRTPLGFMIAFAYNVHDYQRLLGLPKWAENQSYAVAAKPPEGFPKLSPAENREQVRLMMQAMLADRFHLQVHTETRQERVLKLEAAKDGLKIKEVDAPVPPAKEGLVGFAAGDGGGRMIGHKSTMNGITAALRPWFKQQLVDETGLKGYYDFDIQWSAPDAAAGGSRGSGFGAEAAGLLISALQNQFGLRLVSAMGPVTYWVVDHAEPPRGN